MSVDYSDLKARDLDSRTDLKIHYLLAQSEKVIKKRKKPLIAKLIDDFRDTRLNINVEYMKFYGPDRGRNEAFDKLQDLIKAEELLKDALKKLSA